MYDLRFQVDKFGQPAISGQNGSGATYVMACRLWRNTTNKQAVISAMAYYNDTKCKPKWNDKQLQRFIDDAYKAVAAKGEIAKYALESTITTSVQSISSDTKIESSGIVSVPSGFSIVDNADENPDLLDRVVRCGIELLDAKTPLAKQAVAYLQSRGIGAKAVNHFALGVSMKNGMLTIPSFDLSLCVAYAMLRSFPHKRYQRVGKGHCLTGMYGRVGADNVIIVGGQLDVALLWQHTPNDTAIVTLGSDNSSIDELGYQWLLSRKRVVIAMDADDSGALTARKWLQTIPQAVIAPMFPIGKDVGELWQNRGNNGVKAWLNSLSR